MKGIHPLRRKAVVFTFSFVFVMALFSGPLFSGAHIAYVHTRNTIAVVQTGSDHAIAVAIDEMNLSRFNHPVITIKANSPEMLETIIENSIFLITIYVGHGNPEGLLVNGKIVVWSNLKSWIGEADNTFHIITSCFGFEAIDIEAKNNVGFPGILDAQIAGYLVQVLIARLLGAIEITQSLVTAFFTNPIMIRLLFNPHLPLYGPWSSWITNPAVNVAITFTLYALLGLGIALIAAEILAILGVTLAGAALVGFHAAISYIVGLLGALLCEVQWWTRFRYCPTCNARHDQFQFRVLNLIIYQYIWYSVIMDAYSGVCTC